MSDKIRMTDEMFQEHNTRLETLQAQYSRILANLEQARAEGDISDNAAHDIAIRDREQVGKLLMEELEIIERAEVIQGALDVSTCGIFTYVTLEDITTHKTTTVQLVDSNQGKPPIDGNVGRTSVDSQIGREIFGKKVGAVISILDGHLQQRIYKIVNISDRKPNVVIQSAS